MTGRACDACRRRKIKCIGAGLSCRNCSASGLACTFNTIPMKKGPKGHNASVLQELRQPKRKFPLPKDAMNECIGAFYSKLYQVMPILDQDQFGSSIDVENMSTERFCLLSALCALTNIQVLNRPAGDIIRETLRARQTFDYVEAPSLDSVHISFFLFACFFGLNIHNTAWFYLREAITFAQLIGLDNEETYLHIKSRQAAAFRRRTFWVLFVTERAYAIQRHHSLSMQSSIDLPSTIDQDLSENMSGFNFMVDLWSQIDTDFLSMWNDKRFSITADWMIALHNKVANALPSRMNISEVQEADILISQQWLRTILWQLSTSRMLLSSESTNEVLRISFPITISHDLLEITSRLSAETLEVHGIGICEKVFEVASTLVDVMLCDPSLQDPELAGRATRNLQALLSLLGTLRKGTSPWHAIIKEKIKSSMPEFPQSPTIEPALHVRLGSAEKSPQRSNSTTSQMFSPSAHMMNPAGTKIGGLSPDSFSPLTIPTLAWEQSPQDIVTYSSPLTMTDFHGTLSG